MSEHEVFRTTMLGGYDKEDVHEQFRNLKDTTTAERTRMEKEIEEQKAQIKELQEKLTKAEQQSEGLEQEIKEKYKKYIDHYESISHLVVDAQVKADEILASAKEKEKEIIREAQAEANRLIDAAKGEAEEKLFEGKGKYAALQEAMSEIVDQINLAQRRFMSSYKEVHKIIGSVPESMKEFEEDFLDED